MAFVVEDGTGLANANAYCTPTEMRAYWTDRGVTFAQADSLLQVAIILGTDYIENRHKLNFKGLPQFDGQRLAFPRLCIYDHTGKAYVGVPEPLKFATAEYAKRALSTTPLVPDPTLGLPVIREKVGPIETEFLPGATPIYQPYPTADSLLKDLLYAAGSYASR
jgi:hypothetical protein